MSSTCLSPLCNRAPYPCWVLFMSVSLILSTVPCIQELLISVCSKWKLEFISSTRPSMVPGWHRCTNCFITWTNATNLFFFLHRCFRWLKGKESACQWSRCRFEADAGLIPGLGKPPAERNGNPLQYSCLGNSMDRGAWWATVHGVTKSQIQLSDWTTKQ